MSDAEPSVETLRAVHKTIDAVSADMEHMRFNTAIARLIELVNHLTKVASDGGGAPRSAVEALVLMVSPFAPHLAEELWAKLGHDESLARASYPVADPQYLVADAVTCVIQVKGKVRHRIEVDPEISAEDLEKAVFAEERVQKLIEGHEVRKVIVREPKLVNLVLS